MFLEAFKDGRARSAFIEEGDYPLFGDTKIVPQKPDKILGVILASPEWRDRSGFIVVNPDDERKDARFVRYMALSLLLVRPVFQWVAGPDMLELT